MLLRAMTQHPGWAHIHREQNRWADREASTGCMEADRLQAQVSDVRQRAFFRPTVRPFVIFGEEEEPAWVPPICDGVGWFEMSDLREACGLKISGGGGSIQGPLLRQSSPKSQPVPPVFFLGKGSGQDDR